MLKSGFNILAICGAAGFAGVMLCIGINLGSYWRSLPPAEFLNWFAANNQFVAKSIPLIFMPTLIGIVGSVLMARRDQNFMLWAVSGLCIVVVAVLTFAYFVPTNMLFASGTMDAADVPAKLNQWITIHYARIGFAMIAAVLGCIAIKA